MFARATLVEPALVEIGYGESVSVDIGMMDLNTGEFEIGKDEFFITSRAVNFEVLEYPGGDASSWFITFNPPLIHVKAGQPIKSKMTISFRAPPNARNAIQSGIIKIRIKDSWALGNLYWPKDVPEYDTFFKKFAYWFIPSILPMYGAFGKNSGSVQTDEIDINLLVNVKPYHNVRFDSVRLVKIAPSQTISIPINLENLGNYEDTFSFRIASENNKIKISDRVSITLKPGESKDAYLGIAVPPSFLDFGTLHTLKIEAYSIDQPNMTIAERTVYLETQGMYVSEISGLGFVFFGIIVIFAVVFFLYRRRRTLTKLCKKPEKPWNIPIEKEYPEEFKEKDRKKYNEILKMMEDEYISSLLWYKYYRKSLLKDAQKKSLKIFTNIFKRPIKEKKPRTLVTKELKPEISEKEEKKLITDIPAELEKQKRIALLKIKKEQEKQRKKMGYYSIES